MMNLKKTISDEDFVLPHPVEKQVAPDPRRTSPARPTEIDKTRGAQCSQVPQLTLHKRVGEPDH